MADLNREVSRGELLSGLIIALLVLIGMLITDSWAAYGAFAISIALAITLGRGVDEVLDEWRQKLG